MPRRPNANLPSALAVGSVLIVTVLIASTAPPSASPAPGPAPDRTADYRRARAAAHAWLDALPVDAAELIAHEVKGIKKLAEILHAYLTLWNHAGEEERAAIQARVEDLAAQTRRDAYHEILLNGRGEVFDQNSMSYLRVLTLLEQFGVDTRDYRARLAAVQPRLDASLAGRGSWQKAMFAEYYERFGLVPPPAIVDLPPSERVLAERLPPERIDLRAAYQTTHEVFVAYDYGLRREQDRLTDGEIAYLGQALPAVLAACIERDLPDLGGEIVTCLTFLGLADLPVHARAIGWLLDSQNADGTWGDYERQRSRLGRWVDQNSYLHTVLAVLAALVESFEGGW